MSDTSPMTTAVPAWSNWVLVRRLFNLAWRYRLHCLQVLTIQLMLLTMGIGGLSLTGVGIDYIKHKVDGTPLNSGTFLFALPETWLYWQVLGLLAGLILLLAMGREKERARVQR